MKLVICFIWAFWMMSVSTAEGNPADNVIIPEPKVEREEYHPAYGMPLARVKEREQVLCGTKEDFPGFSEQIWTDELGQRWVGLMWIFVAQLRLPCLRMLKRLNL